MDARLDFAELEDFEIFEYIERRSVYIPEDRNNDLDFLDEVDFKQRYRFSKSTVEELVARLSPKLSSATDRNRALSPTEKVLAAIKFFAFGSQQINIGDLQYISQPSASRCIQDVAKCIAELRPQYIYLPQTEADRMEISRQFYNMSGFPSVYGALDCTLIKILSPGGNRAETFRCRKGFFALNVQTMSDPDMLIRNISARWPGSAHDSTVFDNSYLRAELETNVPGKYHVLGDSGYPLRSYLLTPFLNPCDVKQRRYNKAHIKTRNVVERQYGLWKKRFSCLSIPLRNKLDNTQTIIIATAVLHNMAIMLGDFYDDGEAEDSNEEIDNVNTSRNLGGLAKRNAIVSRFF